MTRSQHVSRRELLKTILGGAVAAALPPRAAAAADSKPQDEGRRGTLEILQRYGGEFGAAGKGAGHGRL